MGDFTLADDEADADFLMVVVKRQVELRGHGRDSQVLSYALVLLL
jgi:hypothetical protein